MGAVAAAWVPRPVRRLPVHAPLDRVLDLLAGRLPRVAEHLEAAPADVLASAALAEEVRRHMRSNSSWERGSNAREEPAGPGPGPPVTSSEGGCATCCIMCRVTGLSASEEPSNDRRQGTRIPRRGVLSYGATAGLGGLIGGVLGRTGSSGGGPTGRAESAIFVRDHGALGDGTTDDTAAIRAALAEAAGAELTNVPNAYDPTATTPRNRTVTFTEGLYKISGTLTIPDGVNVTLDRGAVIRAVAAMGPVFDTPLDALAQDQVIDCRGLIDCNELATVGLYIRSFAAFFVRTPHIYGPTEVGVLLGDPEADARSYEAYVTEPFVWRANGRAVPPDSIGIWLRNAGDSTILAGTINGCDIGVRTETGGNTFIAVHNWNYGRVGRSLETANNMTYCFQETPDAGGNTYIACIADTPKGDGFHLAGQGARLIAPKVYNSADTGTDATANGIRLVVSGAASLIEGLHCEGGDDKHRLAADIIGDAYGTSIIGSLSINTLSTSSSVIQGLVPQPPPDLHDSFLGDDGSAPSHDRWVVTAGAGPSAGAQIWNNRMRLTSGATGGHTADDLVLVSSRLPQIADLELTVEVEFPRWDEETHFWVGIRGWSPNATASSGYALEVSTTDRYLSLQRYAHGAPTALMSWTDLRFPSNGSCLLRLRAEGPQVSLSYWLDKQQQPTGSLVTSDPEGVDTRGPIQLALTGSQAAVSALVSVRRFTVRAL